MLAPHMYRLAALCDVSPELLGHCGDKFSVPEEHRYGDLYVLPPPLSFIYPLSLASSSPLSLRPRTINDADDDDDDDDKGSLILTSRETMLSKTPLDLILILSPSELHVPQALLCLKYKKHIFIEKPLANTLSEVDELEKARAESGMIVFVGYMRRYAAAVDLVKRRLEGKGIRYVRVRELIGSVSPPSPSLLCPVLNVPLSTSSRLSDVLAQILSPPSCEMLTSRTSISQPNQQPTPSTQPLHHHHHLPPYLKPEKKQ
jgi:hypothetical protein